MTASASAEARAWAPPTKEVLRTKDRLWLACQLLWLNVLLLPSLVVCLWRTLLPPQGKSLAGQLVVVTGGGRGLGRGLALRLAAEGGRIAVVDFNLAGAEETAADIARAGGVAKAYRANVARPEDVRAVHQAVVDDFGAPVDVVVNNAGILYADPVDVQKDDAVNAVLATNLLSHFWSAREYVPEMRRRNRGHVVAVASLAAMEGAANITAYSASKFGLRGFMESLRDELNLTPGNQIKTTIAFPYFINTSADYVKHWNTRLPPMEIDDAVEAIVGAIKREDESVTVPGHMYFLSHLNRLLPLYFRDKAKEIIYVKVTPSTAEEKESSPNATIANDLFK